MSGITEAGFRRYKKKMAAKNRLLGLQGNMTLRAFSDKCGIGQSTMHNYLHGRQVRFEFIEQICKACHVNVGWFVTGKGNKYGCHYCGNTYAKKQEVFDCQCQSDSHSGGY